MRLGTMLSIKDVTVHDDGYGLYGMRVSYDYDIDRIVGRGITDDGSLSEAILKEALPFMRTKSVAHGCGCSAFCLKDTCDGVLTGRNYDFRHDTSAMMVHCRPKGGYRSVGFADLTNISAGRPRTFKGRMASLAAPFVCLDGINEKGVSIAVLALDSEPINQDTGRPKISTTLMIRAVLDRAASTEEAFEIFKGYDMFAASGHDYHFYVCDPSGDARVFEYDCDSDPRSLIAVSADAVSNFFNIHEDRVLPNRRNGPYGHGRERYDTMLEKMAEHAGGQSLGTAWDILASVTRYPDPDDITSDTQWSVVFNNTERTAQIAFRRCFDERYTFSALDGSIIRG
ncbi:MAG: linear amide C-N hydrolase [Candidatus Methanomethylophilaceae archaeon]